MPICSRPSSPTHAAVGRCEARSAADRSRGLAIQRQKLGAGGPGGPRLPSSRCACRSHRLRGVLAPPSWTCPRLVAALHIPSTAAAGCASSAKPSLQCSAWLLDAGDGAGSTLLLCARPAHLNPAPTPTPSIAQAPTSSRGARSSCSSSRRSRRQGSMLNGASSCTCRASASTTLTASARQGPTLSCAGARDAMLCRLRAAWAFTWACTTSGWLLADTGPARDARLRAACWSASRRIHRIQRGSRVAPQAGGRSMCSCTVAVVAEPSACSVATMQSGSLLWARPAGCRRSSRRRNGWWAPTRASLRSPSGSRSSRQTCCELAAAATLPRPSPLRLLVPLLPPWKRPACSAGYTTLAGTALPLQPASLLGVQPSCLLRSFGGLPR